MSDDEPDESQTELYHFARGAFVDTDWFPSDLDENDEVVRVSEAGQFPELPSPDTEERKPPYIKKLSRELRAEVFRHLSFDRDDSIKFKRDFLLRIFVSAAIHDIHMNQACENMELKSWVGEGNSVDPSNVRHQLLKFDPATVTRMFRQANDALFDIAFEHEYFDDTNEVAIDSTDWCGTDRVTPAGTSKRRSPSGTSTTRGSSPRSLSSARTR
ncbi:hypothetical protein [Natrinema gari]|uniref:Transposase (TCE33) n=1 Tax=Natrinema gari JCM 14663 TaxID=1230459 RepID=L9YSX1_9EURY|nr:hypothetical protein [Natrinema gari]ELY77234.1 transposase (TCE33) [Natrinema gari JCM 14663]